MLPAGHRLRRGADISTVVRRGRRATNPGPRLLVVHVVVPAAVDAAVDARPTADRDDPTPRVGFVVGRAVGGSVVRHRVIRRLRHLVRAHLSTLPTGTDVVVRALPDSARASYDELDHALDAALHRVVPRGGPA